MLILQRAAIGKRGMTTRRAMVVAIDGAMDGGDNRMRRSRYGGTTKSQNFIKKQKVSHGARLHPKSTPRRDDCGASTGDRCSDLARYQSARSSGTTTATCSNLTRVGRSGKRSLRQSAGCAKSILFLLEPSDSHWFGARVIAKTTLFDSRCLRCIAPARWYHAVPQR